MNENDLKIIIQNNYPMFLTNDMTLYAIINKIVEYTNKLIERSNQLAEIFKELQNDTNIKITDLTNQLNTFITNTTNDLNAFKEDINSQITQLETNINNTIANKTQEVNTALENLDVSGQIDNKISEMVSNGDFNDIFETRFASIYNLAYYGTNPPTGLTMLNYIYNSTTNILYYESVNPDRIVPLDKGGLYVYNGNLYYVKDNKLELITNE